MAPPNKSNIKSYIKAVASVGGRLIAAGTGDATEVAGVGVDRLGYGSCVVVISGHANNTATKKLTFSSIKLSDSADNSSFATAVEQLAAAVDVVTGTGDQYGSYSFAIDLSAYRRYVKITATPEHTATGTDTAEWTGVLVLGGPSEKPAA